MAGDHEREEKWRTWLTRIIAGFAGAIAVLALVLTFFVIELRSTQHQLKADEQKTCEVQARGLPASHHLSNAMRDINVLITKTGVNEPPEWINGKHNPIFFALLNLRQELPQYTRLTSKQPMTRKC